MTRTTADGSRRSTPELMDAPDVAAEDLASSLRFIRGVNRWLGGRQALVSWLERWSTKWRRGASIQLLDLGTGSGDLPVAVVGWALSRGFEMRVTAVELHAKTAALARQHIAGQGFADRIEVVERDALELADHYEPAAFDYVHAGMFIHHMPDDDAVVRVLAIMHRLSSRGLVWNDLIRSGMARLGARLITLGAPAIIRHDARVSVEAGFTPAEAMLLANRAGIDFPAVRTHPIFQRFMLVSHR